MARPKEFDREYALKQAMKTFWAKGFDGSSIPDLTTAMGISRSSMYETFGDKQTLFIEAMNYYAQLVGKRRSSILNSAKSVKEGLREYLNDRIDMVLDEKYPGGCFLSNTATSLITADNRVTTAIEAGAERIENEFADFLNNGKNRGDLGSDEDIIALARFLIGVVNGINVIARVQRNRKVLEDIVKVALKYFD